MSQFITYSRTYDSLDGMILQSDRHLSKIENTSLRQLHPEPVKQNFSIHINSDGLKASFATFAAYLSGLWQDIISVRSRTKYTLEKGIKTPSSFQSSFGKSLIIVAALVGLFSTINVNQTEQPTPLQPIAAPTMGQPDPEKIMAMMNSNPVAASNTGQTADSKPWRTNTARWNTNNQSTAAPTYSSHTDTNTDPSTQPTNGTTEGGRGAGETTNTPIVDTQDLIKTPITTQPTDPIPESLNPSTNDDPIVDINLPIINPDTGTTPVVQTPIVNLGL